MRLRVPALLALVGLLGACAITGDAARGPAPEGGLGACPSSPNCVSSSAEDAAHRIEPFVLAAPAAAVWGALGDRLRGRSRWRVVETREDYLHATARTALLRFVDDVEFRLDRARGLVHVRSASRIGWSDLGANRRRLERLRTELAAAGLVEGA